jgi:hypothetical protein
MVIDPAGDFAQQIATWQENADNERLIYIGHDLELGMTPTINPFEIAGVSASRHLTARACRQEGGRTAASRRVGGSHF